MPFANLKSRAWTSFLCFALLLFLSQKVFSMSYAGIIVGKSPLVKAIPSLTIELTKTQQTVVLFGSSDLDRLLFERLQYGDYLSFMGEKLIKKNQFRLVSINYIGLKSVLGFWNADDGRCYEFINFTQIAVYEGFSQAACDGITILRLFAIPKMFKYFITANEDNWDITVTDQESYFSAEFNFVTPNEINAKIFDTETGTIDTELNLWR